MRYRNEQPKPATEISKMPATESQLSADEAALSADEMAASDDEIASIQAKLDAAKTARAVARAKVVADAKARGVPVPVPARDGRFNDEVLDGHRWSVEAHEWTVFEGVDHTLDVPVGAEHVGDGSPEKPHDIRPRA